ncbi:MAG: hypothetical protein HQ556_08250, partial [Candidatus Marinimicrobia bacterium]|nr:hypothetical protein [Candidatus Neomarinimicrobiota bacterium]
MICESVSGSSLSLGRRKDVQGFMKKLIVLLSITILVACQNPQSTEVEIPQGFEGQLETDIDYAIVKPDGTLWTWGGNWTGQLGHGSMSPSETPKQVTTLSGVISIDFSDGGAYAADVSCQSNSEQIA